MELPANRYSVLLLDGECLSRKNIAFLLQVARYRPRVFDQVEECLNWLGAFSPQEEDSLCLIVNGEVGREAILEVIRSVEASSRTLPVLVIDRTRVFRNKKELLGSLFTELPVYVGAAEQILDFLKDFSVLKRALAARERSFQGLFSKARNHGKVGHG